MYLKKIELTNTGPIEHATVECRFLENGDPKPLVLVGKNGSGKSLFLAHIASALMNAHGVVYENGDVERGKVYKLRSPIYIRYGSSYSLGEVSFSNDFQIAELQLNEAKSTYTGPKPNHLLWEEISDDDFSHQSSNMHTRAAELTNELKKSTHLFFPPNRFEDPAWLNEMNLLNKANYFSLKKVQGYSDRPIISYAPLKNIQNWLLDLIYDGFALERIRTLVQRAPDQGGPFFHDIRNGQASNILISIEGFLRTFFNKQGDFLWNLGKRNSRSISVTIAGEIVAANLFTLSTGQTLLLDLFFAVIRDYDLSNGTINNIADITGIVIVDEVDLHLHADLQHDLLPKLIKLFPKVQFILTSHSPLFLLGMEKAFGADGFQLIELPSGKEIEVERFSEFEAAYSHMKESARFEEEVQSLVSKSRKPILYLEGTTDIDYIRKAAELLGRNELIQNVELSDAVGSPHLDKIWNAYKSPLATAVPQKLIILYDCDVQKPSAEHGNLYRRTIPRQPHKIGSGIENLFSDETIKTAKVHKKEFVDIREESRETVRGLTNINPERWVVNKDEKRNLCNWLCEQGTAADFEKFSVIFEMLDDILANENA